MSTYDIGDRRKLTCEVRDEAGDVVDPTGLTFTMKVPAGTLTSYDLADVQLVHDSTGKYHVYWDCTTSGKYFWRFAATGNVAAAEESSFSVRASKVI